MKGNHDNCAFAAQISEYALKVAKIQKKMFDENIQT